MACSMIACLLGLTLGLSLFAEDPNPAAKKGATKRPYQPQVSDATNEAEIAIGRIKPAEGLQLSVFAKEPRLANPVAFCFDEQGRCYVTETFRHTTGVTDNREHMDWLDEDLASRTVADRVALYRRYMKEKFSSMEEEHERVKLIVDQDGDGVADLDTVFADGFHGAEEGIGAGLLARRGNIYYACIPHLWLLGDRDGDGQAEERQSLHYGYGVHVAFIGHDLHGLRMGPDGKLYFSIGDRGFQIEGPAGQRDSFTSYPDTGAVLRCNPDGSNLEVFAIGMRNPQELAFDEYGNLFTGDNNSDSGDQARWVYVVEGGDSGWRIGYQYLTDPISRGPWNEDRLWLPKFAGQAAYVVPPLANFANGPSGLCYYPGTGLPERYKGHFFLCDFRGASSQSGIHAFTVRPDGAGFAMNEAERFVWGAAVTDCDFGVNGGLYFSDWVDGWAKPTKGRIYRVFDPNLEHDPQLAEVRKLLAANYQELSVVQLTSLLAHADMRIRQEAQFALAERKEAGQKAFEQVLSGTHQLARLHAIWGIGMLAGKTGTSANELIPLLADQDAEVRAQAAKVLGETRHQAAGGDLIKSLADESPRVQFFAAQSLGKLADSAAILPLVQLLRQNKDQDVFIRHAVSLALSKCGSDAELVSHAQDASVSVRTGILLALRHQKSSKLELFLGDLDPYLVTEAVRAIYDLPLVELFPQLAELATRRGLPDAAMRRIVACNQRVGGDTSAERLAQIAASDDLSEVVRLEALHVLTVWDKPIGRDRIDGLWRPQAGHPNAQAAAAFQRNFARILAGPGKIRQSATALAVATGTKEVAPTLRTMVGDDRETSTTRAMALRALDQLDDAELAHSVDRALASEIIELAVEGRRVLARIDPPRAIIELRHSLSAGKMPERQSALVVLGGMNLPEADQSIAEALSQMLKGTLPGELHLEALEAGKARNTAELADLIQKIVDARPADDPLAPYRETLLGGDAVRGEAIFFNRSETSCVRCHKVGLRGGAVGPELTTIAKDKNREYLLEAIVDPNRKIAKGFETAIVALADGTVATGIVKSEDQERLQLVTAEGKTLIIPIAEIEERSPGRSAMPDTAVKFISSRDLRDLVEYLNQLNVSKPSP